MPVEDLIRYFNAADRDKEGDSLLYPKGERVEAWHHGLRLSSLFQPIVDLRSERTVGHRASLQAERADGNPLDAEAAYALCETGQSVVRFDRLCRTLHALNFLAQQRSTGGYLQLAVHPRHLLAVQNQHGLVYEAILKRCGLAPEDIVLELAADSLDSSGHFAHALANYRQRGYRVMLRVSSGNAAAISSLILQPDAICLSERQSTLEAEARQRNIPVQLEHIDSGAAFRQAKNDGIELASGELFGLPAVDCRPTHRAANPSYNQSNPYGVPHENRQ